jgi:hypothetical protein
MEPAQVDAAGEGMITREEALNKLNELQGCGDPEATHSVADTVLCDLLESLGYSDVVEKWKTVEKWYA